MPSKDPKPPPSKETISSFPSETLHAFFLDKDLSFLNKKNAYKFIKNV